MSLPKSRRFIADALLVMYQNQEIDEQLMGATVHENGIGFNGVDAPFGTSLAQQLLAGSELSTNQLNAAYKMLGKYHKQLAQHLNFQEYPDDPKAQKDDAEGILDIREKELIFIPRVYPSNQVKEHGFRWDGKNKFWYASFTPERVAAVNKLFKNVTQTPTLVATIGKPQVEEKPNSWEQAPGWLQIIDDTLWFIPMTYPTSQIKKEGWQYRDMGKRKKAWRNTVAPENVYWLQQHFPEVNFHPNVIKWMTQLNTLEINPCTAEIPEMFDFQREGASFLAQQPRAMLSFAPGLGKTLTSIAAARCADSYNILVVAPLTLLRNWQKEVKRWDSEAVAYIWHRDIDRDYRDGANMGKRVYCITNYETLVKYQDELVELGFDTMIADETIMIKNRKAKRTQAVQEVAKHIERVWELTGSPASRYLDDMYSQLQALDPKRFSSYWRFADRYCEIEKDQWGSRIVANKPQATTWLKRDLADVYHARTQEQVLDLPDWIFETVQVEMTAEQDRFYDEIQSELIAEISGMDDSVKLTVSNVLAMITRLIQAASNPMLIQKEVDGVAYAGPDTSGKWDALKEQLEFHELPAIIWVNFINTGKYVAGMLEQEGYRVAMLTGATASNERQDIVERFQNGELDIIVAHPTVGKFGLTLTRARTAIYLERSYNGDDYFQSLHRFRRIGTTQRPVVVHLLSTRLDGQDTVDHVIDAVLNYRTQTARSLTAGDFRTLIG